jgi:hypothetical protein
MDFNGGVGVEYSYLCCGLLAFELWVRFVGYSMYRYGYFDGYDGDGVGYL